jgi:hypothetical protein
VTLLKSVLRHPVFLHLAVLLGYVGVGIAVTWPHATYLAGKLPDTRDAGSYVWGFWWMEQAVAHWTDPWHTTAIAAPVGAQLGMHALIPLAGLLMIPVTAIFGPSASFNVLSIAMPGLMAYAMWRAARLWLPSWIGALAAGAFFGFAAIVDFQAWVHLNLAAGALFLPITLEAAVRLRRRPGIRQAVVLGIVLGASLLVDQESAILCGLLAMAVLLPWLLPRRYRSRPARQTAPGRPTPTAESTQADAPAADPAFPPERDDQPGSRHPRGGPDSEPSPQPVLAGPLPPPTRSSPTPASSLTASGAGMPLTATMTAQAPPSAIARPVPAALDLATPDPAGRPSPATPTTPVARLKSLLSAAGRAATVSALAVLRLPARALDWLRTLPARMRWTRIGVAAIAGLVAVIVALPQLLAIMAADKAGSPPARLSAGAYILGIRLPDMFLPSPRITSFGLTFTHAQNASTYEAIPTLLALIGLGLAWRRRNAWLLGAFWLAAALLAVGSDIMLPSATYTPFPRLLEGVQVSAILPFTWFAQIPGLSGFREPNRIAELGLIPVALLAGYTVNWLRYHSRPLLVVALVLAVFEAGLATPTGAGTMPTTLPALDRPIAADHSHSIVVDIPFGLRGGTGVTGLSFATESQVLATADGHPLADALLSRVPTSTVAAMRHEPFYADLISAQTGHYNFTPAQFAAAAENVASMDIGWVMLWVSNKHLRNFLVQTGFSYLYRADHVSVWRPAGYANTVLTTH